MSDQTRTIIEFKHPDGETYYHLTDNRLGTFFTELKSAERILELDIQQAYLYIERCDCRENDVFLTDDERSEYNFILDDSEVSAAHFGDCKRDENGEIIGKVISTIEIDY